ncbi:MAG: CvpA family protein [Lachnospiraceae bacterium]|nr:CvpA family protein [Lachnospiraceae bacterium]
MNTLTLVVMGIIAVGILVGYHKVFAKKVLMIIVTIFALVQVVYFGPTLAQHILDGSKIDEALEDKVSALIQNDINTKIARDLSIATGVSMDDISSKKIKKIAKATYYINPADSARANIFRYSGFPESITRAMVDLASKYDKTYIAEKDFADYVSIFLVERAIKIAADIFLYLFITISFQIAIAYMERNRNENNVTLFGYINRVGGAVLGGFTAMIIVWVLLTGLQLIPSNLKEDANKQINDSAILTFIQDNNLLTTMYEDEEITEEEVIETLTTHIK